MDSMDRMDIRIPGNLEHEASPLSEEQLRLREEISEGVIRGGIDLHLHSTASDGTLPPEKFPDFAASQGLSLFSLTDHDSIDGHLAVENRIRERLSEGLQSPAFIPGVELSLRTGKNEEIHLLGYFPTTEAAKALQPFIEKQRRARRERNAQLLEKLRSAGYAVDGEAVEKMAKGQLGRVHFALYLIQEGYVESVEEAFRRILGEGGSCYIPRRPLNPFKGIQAISEAGGLSYLAHPFKWKAFAEPERFEEELRELKEGGLVGLEAFHGDAKPEETKVLLRSAKRLGLSISAGSDWHGGHKKTRAAFSGGTHFDLKA